jgi:hypothetical protein
MPIKDIATGPGLRRKVLTLTLLSHQAIGGGGNGAGVPGPKLNAAIGGGGNGEGVPGPKLNVAIGGGGSGAGVPGPKLNAAIGGGGSGAGVPGPSAKAEVNGISTTATVNIERAYSFVMKFFSRGIARVARLL